MYKLFSYELTKKFERPILDYSLNRKENKITLIYRNETVTIPYNNKNINKLNDILNEQVLYLSNLRNIEFIMPDSHFFLTSAVLAGSISYSLATNTNYALMGGLTITALCLANGYNKVLKAEKKLVLYKNNFEILKNKPVTVRDDNTSIYTKVNAITLPAFSVENIENIITTKNKVADMTSDKRLTKRLHDILD